MNTLNPTNSITERKSEITALTETALLAAAQAGQEWAFAELCRRNSQRVFNTIFRITKNREDAEDALQESIMKAFIHIGSFDGRSTFTTWFTRIGINSALMILRKKRTRSETSIDFSPDESENWQQWEISDESSNPEERYIACERAMYLRREIGSLPETFRSVIEIRQIHGSSMQEIARTMGLSTSATKSRLARAKRALRTSLIKRGFTDQAVGRSMAGLRG